MLLASGPLRFRGSESEPVVLAGVARAGSARSWGGIVAIESGEPHEWEHVEVRDTTGVAHDGWRLTAGVTLRAAETRLLHTRFTGNRTEDALNLIRSRCVLQDVSIHDTSSDAFDCDFCDGSVTGGRIDEVGGDGIDVSGSKLEVRGVELLQIRDKAVSVGERSQLVARALRIQGVGTALAAKDGSIAIFEDSDVADVQHVAIMAYTKKREFGPARVEARDIRMHQVGRAAVAQLGSVVEIDGAVQVAEDVDVEKLYSEGYMKK
jgi:hypothetical protein